jgi:RNA polymerase sigma factor (TIGR02999 family)
LAWQGFVLTMSELTQVLEQAGRGGPHAVEELLPLVYNELRGLAARKMANEVPGQTLQATALVHEVWLRLSQQSRTAWTNQAQFYTVAAEVMRRILVDRARRRHAQKHGGHLKRVELDSVDLPIAGDDGLILRVHEALGLLELEDATKAEVAALLGISQRTVHRHWAFAKAWLFRAMRQG